MYGGVHKTVQYTVSKEEEEQQQKKRGNTVNKQILSKALFIILVYFAVVNLIQKDLPFTLYSHYYTFIVYFHFVSFLFYLY